jgi:bacillopeptidase F (M6 metalloprotease family)
MIVEPKEIVIDGRQSKTITVTVNSTDVIEPNDWTEVIVNVKRVGKKKVDRIELMTMIRDGKSLLQITDVTNTPAEFNAGDRVNTFFKVWNKGTISARNIKVFLYINGKQKNNVEVTIPAGGVADIEIPWIAVKGKNQLRIRLKE